MISEQITIESKTLVERGIPQDSYFEIVFEDGSQRNESNTNWRDFSIEKDVKYGDRMKTVMVSRYNISKITMNHGSLQKIVDVSANCEVYQAIRSQSAFSMTGKGLSSDILGRSLGLVQNDEVIEEYFLNGITNEIIGFKK